MKVRNFGAVLALGALAALPACSMFGGSSSDGTQYRQSNATATSSYSTASSSTGTSGTMAPVSPTMIRNVQTTLKQNNDYSGQVDGVWGPMTERGVRTWQQSHNLTTSGEIDMATLQSMNISTDNQTSQNNDNNAATQPTGNPNYSTNQNRTTGSTYSNNNAVPPNTPYPANQTTNNPPDTAAPASTAPATSNR